jgi:UDP-N-acetyl-2-amino-2-deoxyglucuronate dehydrogenase
LKRQDTRNKVHYVTICSPNYLHDAHIRTALRVGADAICEKPLVLNPWNLDALAEQEEETGQKVYTVLQLRVHPALLTLKNQIDQETHSEKHEIDLTYITSRGKWYLRSWKGNLERSGGLASNIGIHFYDMLIWLFGNVEKNEVHFADSQTTAGYFELERARVTWFLSIDSDNLPNEAKSSGQGTYRSITIDENEIEFSGGFKDLHTVVYQKTLEGNGFRINDTRAAIQIVHDIRKAVPLGIKSNSHRFLKK